MPENVFASIRKAIVRIRSSFSLTTSGYVADTVPEDLASYFLSGNGFFIKCRYIICPASLVLIAPSALATRNRFPYESPAILPPTGDIPNRMVRVNRVLVDVTVGEGTYTYEAQILGVDGAGDIAVLTINRRAAWNSTNPKVPKKQPYLLFSNNLKTNAGSKVFAAGCITANLNSTSSTVFNIARYGSFGVAQGVVSNPKYVDTNGFLLQECILTDIMVSGESVGLPFVNERGYLLGMQTTNVATLVNPAALVLGGSLGDGGCAGPSACFMWRVISAIIRRKQKHLLPIVDSMGDYFRYAKGFVGVYAPMLTGGDYDVIYSGSTILERFSTTGQLLNSPGLKKVMGAIATGIAGAGTTIFVAGSTAVPPFPALVDTALPADAVVYSILVSLDCVELGALEYQYPPSAVTWRKLAGDKVKLLFRTPANQYETVYEATITLADFPALFDYPWYKIASFPAPTISIVPSVW